MVVHSVYIINKAGSLIYHYDHNIQRHEVERSFNYPLDFVLDFSDDRLMVKFGERDGIKVGHAVLSINGISLAGRMVPGKDGTPDQDVLEYLNNSANFPMNIKFGRPPLKTNERIMLASTFHSLFAISAQLSPEPNSSGMTLLDTDVFRLHCFQTITGTKFLVVTDLKQEGMDAFLRKLYQVYADFALKNPFHQLDQPEYVNFSHSITRYTWKDIEAACGELISDDDFLENRIEDASSIISDMDKRIQTGVPFDMKNHLGIINSDLVIIRFIQKAGLDARIYRIRCDHWHKFDYALIRWLGGFLPDYGQADFEIVTCEFLCIAAVWTQYELEVQDGDDYNLEDKLLASRLPKKIINRILFSPERDKPNLQAPYAIPSYLTFRREVSSDVLDSSS